MMDWDRALLKPPLIIFSFVLISESARVTTGVALAECREGVIQSSDPPGTLFAGILLDRDGIDGALCNRPSASTSEYAPFPNSKDNNQKNEHQDENCSPTRFEAQRRENWIGGDDFGITAYVALYSNGEDMGLAERY
jgi:hypothetical protein